MDTEKSGRILVAELIDDLLCLYERVFIVEPVIYESLHTRNWFNSIRAYQSCVSDLRDQDKIDAEMANYLYKMLAALYYKEYDQKELHKILKFYFSIEDGSMIFHTYDNENKDKYFAFPIMREKMQTMKCSTSGNIENVDCFYLIEMPYTFCYAKINRESIVAYSPLINGGHLIKGNYTFKVKDLEFSVGRVFGCDGVRILNCPYTKESLEFVLK